MCNSKVTPRDPSSDMDIITQLGYSNTYNKNAHPLQGHMNNLIYCVWAIVILLGLVLLYKIITKVNEYMLQRVEHMMTIQQLREFPRVATSMELARLPPPPPYAAPAPRTTTTPV
ncbi:hypothetical protein JYU34_002039 [Plutella xylostella]|uniref:Uncharacterized protein n=1 Tax=Plutella xylostella TaxID=51655 RepID=A0ABQ7QW09_PLUXY|nr:hypothetical protein JYU34_020873 [Plutella xylostella]KAG7297476.1 hypothetical protein JYU34_019487 [Plutella xylostella]KAG7300552.1 hypothetical protein JYU34_016199 [Plutella xylostella]KAG7309230.1 hypothetical protein JYU34_005158 [Plutella xylostella]KAG7312518.1 hypothetical protein JYU34_002039 [Plutella xylostella]